MTPSSIAWSLGFDDDFGQGLLDIYLYPRSECVVDTARGPVADALLEAFRPLHRDFDEDLSEELPQIGQITCLYGTDPVSVSADEDTGDVGEDFYNVVDAFRAWREANVGDTPGVHILVDGNYEYSDAARVTDIDAGVRPAYATPRDAVVGADGNMGRVRNLAIMEACHNLIDSESIPAVDEMLAGSGHHAEHQLGRVRAGSVTPMATLYEGSDVWEEYNGDPPEQHAEYGTCSGDGAWTGGHIPHLTRCTREAVYLSLQKDLRQ